MIDVVLGLPLAAIRPPLTWWALILAALLLIIRNDVVRVIARQHMLGLAGLAAQMSAATLFAGLLVPVWWHQWMYANWSGPPVWLSDVFRAAGSEIARSVGTEMTLALLATLISAGTVHESVCRTARGHFESACIVLRLNSPPIP